jgi:hypothetical protein
MCVSLAASLTGLTRSALDALTWTRQHETGPRDAAHLQGRRKLMSWYHALSVLLHILMTHHVHHWHWMTYGYGHKSSNAGVVVRFGKGQCIGYETKGHPGYFGNAFGFKGGDCS